MFVSFVSCPQHSSHFTFLLAEELLMVERIIIQKKDINAKNGIRRCSATTPKARNFNLISKNKDSNIHINRRICSDKDEHDLVGITLVSRIEKMWKYRHGTQTPTNLTLAGIHIAQK